MTCQIIRNIQNDCANLANVLGFSWIWDQSFEGEPTEESNQAVKNADETDADTSKSRKFKLQNHGRYSGFATDRYTNMVFGDWALEQSDYVLGTPVVTEVKPSMVFSQTYPAEKNDRPATIAGNFTVSNTVTNSNTKEGNFAMKLAIASKINTGIADVTKTLEGTFGAKFAKTWGDSEQRSFQVSGS